MTGLKVEPFEALRLPELNTEDRELARVVRELLIAVAGFPYAGATRDGIVYALRWMRAHPDRADVLLGRADEGGEVQPLRAAEARVYALCDQADADPGDTNGGLYGCVCRDGREPESEEST